MRIQTILILLLASFSLTGQSIMLAGGAAVEEGGFDANDIVGLEGWYSATDMDGDGIENEETSAPDIWVDKSTKERNLTKSGTVGFAVSQVNGQNVLKFSGSGSTYYQAATASDWIFLHNSTQSTIFLVFEVGAGATNTNNFNTIYTTMQFSSSQIGNGLSIDDRAVSSRDDALFFVITNGVSSSQPVFDIQNDKVSHNAFHVMTINADPSNSTAASRSSYKVDVTEISGGNSNTFPPSESSPQYPLTIGSNVVSFGMIGYFAEIIIYSRALSAEERTTVETYLSNKYGI